MKLTVAQVRNIWFGINAIYNANEVVPTKWEFHVGERMIPVLAKEQERIEKLSPEKFQELSDDTLDLPISKIDPSILPDKMPQVQSNMGAVSALKLIKPILNEDEQPEYESQLGKMLDGQENGKEEVKEDV